MSFIESLKKHPKFTGTAKVIVASCPGRISLSKHCDYVNNDLLYTTDDRLIYCASQLNDDGKLTLINEDPDYPDISFDINSLNSDDKNNWDFYIRKLITLINSKYQKSERTQGLTLIYKSKLPTGGGLSSSHALILVSLVNILEQFKIKIHDKLEILKLCQEVEHARGFKSGLGDQAAQLLSKKDHFLCLRLFPRLEHSYIKIPEELSIITVPSFIKADKSLAEFNDANLKITAYKLANLIFANAERQEFLGDLLYKHKEKELLNLLSDLKEELSLEEIAELASKNYLQANSDIHDADKAMLKKIMQRNIEEMIDKSKIINKPKTWPIKALALYGLAEGARIKNLKENFSIKSLGEHLNKSHQAERNFDADGKALKASYFLDPKQALKDHIGLYNASTAANDSLQSLALELPEVYGSSITGAGLGGNNLVLCQKGAEEKLMTHLLDNYYSKHGLADKAMDKNLGMHIVKSAEGLTLIDD